MPPQSDASAAPPSMSRPGAQAPGKEVALVLQGGGALGSYQAGVYEALAGSDYLPDWVAGISIGAINCALIAGNRPAERVAALRAFWEEITQPTASWQLPHLFDPLERKAGAMGALLFGQPGFFAPRRMMEWLQTPKPTSFYDTGALRSTLERLVDFDRINAKEIRFSVGAVNVRTGGFAYFDNHRETIRPEHVMASGALPPGFPAVEIDGESYWDGGLVSNTPLQYVMETEPRKSQLMFQVDVFQSYGVIPQTLDQVTEREKDIRFASRTRVATEAFEEMHNIRSNAHDLWMLLPDDIRRRPEAQFLEELGCVTEMDVVQLIYRPFEPQGSAKDYEFSRATMVERWDQGRSDAATTLLSAPWTQPHPPSLGSRVFDVMHDIYVAAQVRPRQKQED